MKIPAGHCFFKIPANITGTGERQRCQRVPIVKHLRQHCLDQTDNIGRDITDFKLCQFCPGISFLIVVKAPDLCIFHAVLVREFIKAHVRLKITAAVFNRAGLRNQNLSVADQEHAFGLREVKPGPQKLKFEA